MSDILIERDVSPLKLEVLGVEDWAMRREEVASSERAFAQTETTYIVSGRAEIILPDGELLEIDAGDLVTFLPDSRCVWKVIEAMERAYRTS